MKIRDIFESSFAIELARDLAERQETLPPHKIIKKLIRFAIIGAVSLAIIVVMIFMIRSTLGDDANTRQVLVFASFASALVFVSAIGAVLVTLWDGFVGQYIQRLALMDSDQDASQQEVVFEIPVVDLPEPLMFAEGGEHLSNVVVSVEDEEFIHDGDLSVSLVADRLEGLKQVLSQEEWANSRLQEHLVYFETLNRNLTVGRNLTDLGKSLFATAIPMMSTPALIARYRMTGQVANILGDIEQSITRDEDEVIADQPNQAAAS